MPESSPPPSAPQPDAPRSHRRPSAIRSRRPSTSQRINEILEAARERADRLGSPGPASPTSPGDSIPMFASWEQSTSEGNTGEDEANETTSFNRQNTAHSYQSVRTEDSRPPPVKSIYSRTSQPRSRPHQDPQLTADQHTDGAANGGVSSPSSPPQRWWRKVLGKFQTVELENKGSTARDHLALERTFLAWLRTSLAFASIGVAVTQLFRLNTSLPHGDHSGNTDTLRHMGKPLGATFLGISILVLLLGSKRYFETQEWVIKGKFPASRGTILITTFVALAIMVLSLIVVVVIHPETDKDL